MPSERWYIWRFAWGYWIYWIENTIQFEYKEAYQITKLFYHPFRVSNSWQEKLLINDIIYLCVWDGEGRKKEKYYYLSASDSHFFPRHLFRLVFSVFLFKRESLTALDTFNLAMTSEHLYSDDSQLVDELLHEMATRKIVRVGKCWWCMDWMEVCLNILWYCQFDSIIQPFDKVHKLILFSMKYE